MSKTMKMPNKDWFIHRIYDTIHIDKGVPQRKYAAFKYPIGTNSKFILDGKVISKPKTLLQTNMDLGGQLYTDFIINGIILNFKSLRKDTKRDIQRIRESSYFEIRFATMQVICMPLLFLGNNYYYDVTYGNDMIVGPILKQGVVFEVSIKFDVNVKLIYPMDIIVSLVGLKRRPL